MLLKIFQNEMFYCFKFNLIQLKMKIKNIFIDGSLNPQKKIGYGSYLVLDEDMAYTEELKSKVVLKRFEDTSSTKLEVQNFLWCIDSINCDDCMINIYTDCQNLVGLEERREKLESKNYYTSKDKLIKNHELYKEFYRLFDRYKFNFIKVKGHKKNSLKNEIDKIFNIVDKASREELRSNLS